MPKNNKKAAVVENVEIELEDNEPDEVPLEELASLNTSKMEEETQIQELTSRVLLLEKKAMIACQICSQICPQKAVDRVEKLDAESKGFTVKQSITIGGAREIQRVYGQIVALALGHEANLLYKVSILGHKINHNRQIVYLI